MAEIAKISAELCTRTLALMKDDTSKGALDRLYATYFLLTSGNEVTKHKNSIMTSISKIEAGLMGDLTVKIFTSTNREGRGALGYVTNRDPNSKKGKNNKISVKQFLTAPNGDGKYMIARQAGAIHIAEKVLDNKYLAVVTFLHEASHRFAGTHDSDDNGYFEDDGSPGTSFTVNSWELATHNADSFGWFIAKAGKLHPLGNAIAI